MRNLVFSMPSTLRLAVLKTKIIITMEIQKKKRLILCLLSVLCLFVFIIIIGLLWQHYWGIVRIILGPLLGARQPFSGS
jgi:hypothetical protein